MSPPSVFHSQITRFCCNGCSYYEELHRKLSLFRRHFCKICYPPVLSPSFFPTPGTPIFRVDTVSGNLMSPPTAFHSQISRVCCNDCSYYVELHRQLTLFRPHF